MHSYNLHTPYSGSRYSSNHAVKSLLIINVVFFILVHLLPRVSWLRLFGLVPGDVFTHFKIWQLATYMFLHAGLWHLAINMLMLWLFGRAIEASWGRGEFLKYYFFTGIGAGLCSFIMNFRSPIPVIGASGAIFGILVAYAMMFPDTVILLFFIFPMKIKQAVIFLAAINLLGALSSSGAGIAYFAHLGGGLFGYLYLKNEWIRRKIAYWDIGSLKSRMQKKQKNKTIKTQKQLDTQVDIILDKISKRGMKGLSAREKGILKRKSKSP